ncbi:MAG: 3-deoxy-manno-octulosonate cytidylyltransferase [Oligoflexia bacterium]|nr:3-deoxy-manno-octulosonate cytidylyltransferase [Oligoflexia bacterium]
MKIIGVIPARYGSTRLEGKPLKPILGKPLLEWVIDGAKKSLKINELLVATDDERIAKLSEKCGVKAVMTDSSLPTGSDRIWAAIKSVDCDVVINIQGDEPLLTGLELDALAGAFTDKSIEMATLARPLKNDEELNNPTVAKIVLGQNNNALYFSRFPIPHSRIPGNLDAYACLKHIGFYGYTKEFLGRFCKQKPVALELAEGLEQLRALWLGATIRVILTQYDSWGVDTPEDVIRVEEILKTRKGSTR